MHSQERYILPHPYPQYCVTLLGLDESMLVYALVSNLWCNELVHGTSGTLTDRQHNDVLRTHDDCEDAFQAYYKI